MQTAEYLETVLQIIRANQRIPGLKASTLGQLIMRRLPNERWTQFGFPTLKSLLLQLQQRGAIKLDLDAQKTLAVWVSDQPPPTTPANEAPPPSQKFNPLKPDFWRAFAISWPTGRRFANRVTGSVRMGLTEDPHPADQWTEITPISEADQKDWARQFLVDSQRNDLALHRALDQTAWFVEFPRALRTTDRLLAFAWNRTRSEKVSAAVQNWCLEKKFDLQLAFEQPAARAPKASSAQAAHALGDAPDKARAIVLAALSRMSTDELVEIPIPAKYLLQELGL